MTRQPGVPPVRDEHLHHVLRIAVCGGLTRTACCGVDGVRALRVEGVPATDNQRWWVTVADRRGWLVWLPPVTTPPGREGAALSETGRGVFAGWERQLWGPPAPPVTGSRPPACLGDRDPGLVEQALEPPGGVVTCSAVDVMAVTAEFYGTTVLALRGPRKTKGLAWARQVAMYLCRELGGLSWPRIGREFGRHHTTVMHAHRKVSAEAASRSRTGEQVRDLAALIPVPTAMVPWPCPAVDAAIKRAFQLRSGRAS